MTMKLSLCMQAITTLHPEDTNALGDKIAAYRTAGMDDRQSERAAVADLIAQAEARFKTLGGLLREQHPDLFVAANEPVKPETALPAAGSATVVAQQDEEKAGDNIEKSDRAQRSDGVSALFQEALEAGQRGSSTLSDFVTGPTFLGKLRQLLEVPSNAGVGQHAAQLVDANATTRESHLNGVRSHAQALADILNTKPGLNQRLGAFDVKTQRLVLPHVLALGKDGQVLKAVVQLVPVDVVNDLAARQLSPESLFNDPAMVKAAVAENLGDAVPLGRYTADTLVRTIALAGAEVSSTGVRANLVGPAMDANPASAANDVDLRHGVDDTRNDGRTDEAGNVAIHEPTPAYGLANTESQAYDAGEPDSNGYETDLFGDPIPAPKRSDRKAQPASAGVRGNVQPEPAVPGDTPAPDGEYHTRTVVGVTAQRKLGASVIKTAADAAAATRYLYKSAVERFDGIVTDKDGKPLAVIGGFKGAIAEAAVYPGTMIGEAMRIPGAAFVWFSHNHPSGMAVLSRADEALAINLNDAFRGSGVEPKGLMVVAGDRFAHSDTLATESIPASNGEATVPVIERELVPGGQQAFAAIDSPATAKQAARAYYAQAGVPGMILTDSQLKIVAWVPLPGSTKGKLRGTGGLNAIYRAVSEANAGGAILVHGGEFDTMPLVDGMVGVAQNIGAALKKVDVKPLDVINAKTGESYAEQGRLLSAGPVLSRPAPFYSALAKSIEASPMNAGQAGAWKQALKGMVSAGKVKADEVAWTGIEEWMDLQPGKITKAQIAEFLKNDGVRVEETVLQDGYESDLDPDDEFAPSNAKYRQYTLPGATNYREVLLTLPERKATAEVPDLVAAGWKVEVTKSSEWTGQKEVVFRKPDGEWAGMRSAAPFNATDAELLADWAKSIANQQLRDSFAKANYRSNHWDQPNVLAHIRVNDRTDAEGKRVLFVEEIQSDWAQEGKKKGFQPGQAGQRRFQELGSEWDTLASAAAAGDSAAAARQGEISDEMNAISDAKRDGLPAAPFVGKTDAWVALALKRIVKMAVDEGYDRVAFVTGEQSADRYDLSKQIERVVYLDNHTGGVGKPSMEGPMSDGTLEAYDHDGKQVLRQSINDVSKIEEYVGKEVAQRLADAKPSASQRAGIGVRERALRGLDLKVGGEGMKAFYDRIIPAVAKDVLRKVGGGTLGTVDIGSSVAGRVQDRSNPDYAPLTQPGFDITPAMREKVAAGLPLFKRSGMEPGQMTTLAKTLAAGLKSDITVLASPFDLTGDERKQMLRLDPNGMAEGVFFPDTGRTYLFSNNVHSAEAVLRVTLHESFHRGLHVVMGEEGAAMLRRIHATNKRVRDLAAAQMEAHGIDQLTAINEALAELAGSGEATRLNLWQQLVRMVREFVTGLAKLAGVEMEWTDARVLDLVARMTKAGLRGEPSVSMGDGLAMAKRDDTNTPTFRRWFGSSKITNADGSPRVMYHGTGADITSFRAKQAGAIFVTDEPIFAQAYANASTKWLNDRGQAGGENILPVYVKAENPFDYDNPKHVDALVDRVFKQAQTHMQGDGNKALVLEGKKTLYTPDVLRYALTEGNWSLIEMPEIQAAIKAAGHDAFYVNEGDFKNLAVYEPTQVKSAIGNNGAFDPTNPNILLSRPSRRHTPDELEALAKAGQRPNRRLRDSIKDGWDGAKGLIADRGTIAESLRQDTLDQFFGIQRAIKRDVGNLPTEADPYITARLANGGTSSVMRALLLHGQARWSANHQHLEKIPGTRGLLDILQPLGDSLPDFFGWMVGNRAARLLREGRENNFDAAQIATLQGLADTPEKLALFRATALEYAAFKRSVLDVAEGAGLIDGDSRAMWDNADYVPFYRQADQTEAGVAGGQVTKFMGVGRKGLAGQSSGIRKLTGGEAALNDPVENLLMNFSRLIDASLKNNALDVTIKTLEAADSEAISRATYDFAPALVVKSEVKKQLIEAGTPEDLIDLIPEEAFQGIAKMWSIKAPADPDVIRLMRGGKAVYIKVHDPLLLKAATSFVPFDFPGLGLARMFKRVLTGAVTATPEFIVRNWIRDSAAVQGIGRDNMSPHKSVSGIVRAFKEDGAAEAMLFAGASFQGGNINGNDSTATARSVRRALRQKGLDATAVDNFMGTIVDKPARLWELYRKLGESVENANREAVFEAAIKHGKSVTAAAFEAKDLMDFSLRGSHPIYQVAADVLPFFNARVQGMYRLGRTNPKRLAVYGAIMATVSVALVLANSGEDWYDELADWDKDAYWHFKVMGEHFRLPKPFELGVAFATVPERIARYLADHDSGKKFGKRLWANVRDQLAFDPVPQIVRPAANVWANKDTFRDSPIESAGDEGKLPHLRFSGNTSATARSLARGMAPVADALDLSPKKIEYLVGGYLGTAGLYALGLSDMVVRQLEDYPVRPTLRTDELPIVRSFYKQDPARGTVYESEIYKLREHVNQVYKSANAAFKQGDVKTALKLQREFKPELAARDDIEGAAQGFAELNRVRDQIMASTTMTAEQKRAKLDKVQQAKNELAKRAATSKPVQALQ